MNYTEKHHLPQWVKSDRIMMDDFNAAMANIEKGLIQGPAAVSEEVKVAAQAAAAAQATADRAVAAAAAAQAKADAAYSPNQPPYVVGSYTVNATVMRITLGFRPRFVVIGTGLDIYQNNFSRMVGAPGSGSVSFTNDGFIVGKNGVDPDNGTETPPYLSKLGMTYHYIAFR